MPPVTVNLPLSRSERANARLRANVVRSGRHRFVAVQGTFKSWCSWCCPLPSGIDPEPKNKNAYARLAMFCAVVPAQRGRATILSSACALLPLSLLTRGFLFTRYEHGFVPPRVEPRHRDDADGAMAASQHIAGKPARLNALAIVRFFIGRPSTITCDPQWPLQSLIFGRLGDRHRVHYF